MKTLVLKKVELAESQGALVMMCAHLMSGRCCKWVVAAAIGSGLLWLLLVPQLQHRLGCRAFHQHRLWCYSLHHQYPPCAHLPPPSNTEEVTKTKRALIRAVNKQMQLALKIDGLQAAYEKASRPRLLPRFGL